MSHIVEIKTEVRDPTAVRAACQRLKLPQPIEGTHRLYSGEVRGFGVQLTDWRYPVVCDLATGQLQFDNFNGRWGDPEKLGRLLQMYAVEKARIEARRQGYSMTEQPLADGSIKLNINVGE